MHPYQQAFLELAIQYQVLQFGDFKLKSGRNSPYFFNSGLFYSSSALAQLGQFYAQAIHTAGITFDGLFGPAYKGIPLVAATAIALAEHYHQDIPYSYNRKQAKDHGEGGQIVGAPLAGRILMIDDVITAGTALREVRPLIETAGAQLVGVVVAFNRQERGLTQRSITEEIAAQYGIPIISIVSFTDLIEFLATQTDTQPQLTALRHYQRTYGAGEP